VAITTGDKAPEFDLEETHDRRVRLADYLGRSNVLLVFHPFAFTSVCEEEARDLQENLESFRNANTEIVFVSCDTSAARQAWKRHLAAEYTFASDFWPHGTASKAYGVTRAAAVPHKSSSDTCRSVKSRAGAPKKDVALPARNCTPKTAPLREVSLTT
jgi:peroxiredoxin